MKRSIILTALIAIVLAACSDSPAPDQANQQTTPHAAIAPEAVEAALNAAEEYFQTRDLAKAEAILLRLLERAPNEPRALELHAQLLMAKALDARDHSDHTASADLFNQAYQRYADLANLQPNSAGIHQSAGEVAQVAGRDDDALRHYQKAQQLSPNDPKPHFFAAQIHIQRGKHDQAIQSLQHVLAIDPDEPLAHASLANIAAQQGRYEDAIQHITEARQIRPADTSLRVIEASIHRRSGNPKLALQLLITLDQQQRAAWFVAEELAAIHTDLAQLQQVAQTWAHVYRTNPRDPRAYRAAVNAGHAMLQLGNRTEAKYWLDQALLDAPNAPETKTLATAFRETD